uniref:Alpha-carbonic anhydrase domain-containing protein n=1 Tax=Sinocyclocheilus rhinocerous TaxID=307959 RepID=A0A673GNP4_9TELE
KQLLFLHSCIVYVLLYLYCILLYTSVYDSAGTLNQNNWAKKYPSCNNAKQSPINIEESLAHWPFISVMCYLSPVKDNVQSAILQFSECTLSLTFHWKSECIQMMIRFFLFLVQMQIYCYEADVFSGLDEALSAGGKITALAVLFKVSMEALYIYVYFSNFFIGLLPNSTEKYLIYNGSLTTPPCSETVEWIVFKNTVTISDVQVSIMDSFRWSIHHIPDLLKAS